MVGHLKQRLYDTHGAADNLQKAARKFVAGISFSTGRYKPCMHYHSDRKLRILGLRDDFAASGSREHCTCLKQQMKRSLEIKTEVIALGEEGERQEGSLNIVARLELPMRN